MDRSAPGAFTYAGANPMRQPVISGQPTAKSSLVGSAAGPVQAGAIGLAASAAVRSRARLLHHGAVPAMVPVVAVTPVRCRGVSVTRGGRR